MANVHTENKLKLLFKKLAEPNYVLNNYYADGLINKLSNCGDPEISFLKSVPLISDLILNALQNSENAHISIKVFVTRVLAIVAHNELHFAKMFAKHGDYIANGFKEIRSPSMCASLRVAYMEVALATVTHNSGVAWLLETGVWREMLSVCNERRTVFVVRQTYRFASNFLWKLNDLSDEANLRIVLAQIMKPLSDTNFIDIQSMTSDEEDKIGTTLEPMLQIFLSVVADVTRIQQASVLMSIIIKELKLTTYLYLIFDRMRREDITLLTVKLIFHMVHAKMFLSKPMSPNAKYTREDFMDIGVMYFNTIQGLIQRRSAILVLDFCSACNLIWTTIWKGDENLLDIKKDNQKKCSLQNKLLFMCLVPCLVYVKKVGNHLSLMSYERLDEYILKILNSNCEHTTRAAYALRDLTLELDAQNVTLQSVKRLTCLKSHLNNEQANLIFQALFYILKEFEPVDDNGDFKQEEAFENCEEKVQVMTYVLDVVLCLVKNYDITWHESLEVLCLYTVIHNILKRPNLSCKFVVTALNLIAVTVRKFIPPNLSLLMESKPGSAMHDLGKLIYMKMHDLNWEVRDSALEVLFVCTDIAFIKFPPLQKQLMENNLINVAAIIALNDHEFYVQASALKCLGAASKIGPVWEQLKIQYPDIQEKIVAILRNNQEGIVRKEACNVLCEVFQNVKLSPSFRQYLYDHMVSSAVGDFHWEVQLSALKFWKMVIQTHLTNQGMLDGTFPPVTFSKETRKIVTLNEVEIKKRLLKILNELASIGCLHVLVKLLNEEFNEVEIMESALSISVNLINILTRHKVVDHIIQNNDDAKSINDLMCNVKQDFIDYMEEIETEMVEPGTSQRANNVIEGIVNTDDINLLATIYEQHMSLKTEGNGEKIYEQHMSLKTEGNGELVEPRVILTRRVSPHLFVTYFNSQDYKEICDQKKKWNDGIRNISSLLDDVLGIYDINAEANTLDCY